MFLGKLIMLTIGVTIISLSQLLVMLSVIASSFSASPVVINSDNKFESLFDNPKIIFSQICEQNWTIQCLPLLSMNSGRPISEIDSPMKIKFRQSGGYAGLIKGCEIDTELLSAQEAQKLKSLVEQSGVLNAQSKKSPNGADAYNYHLIIETVQKTYQVSFDEQNLAEEVIPLIDFLEERSDYIKQK